MVEVFLECKNIEKSFGKKRVLKNVDLELKKGCALLLLGHNGAGKTTLCKIIALLSKPTKGKLFFDGNEVEGNTRIKYKESIGFLSHHTFLYNHLTAYENLDFFASLYCIKEKERKIPYLMNLFSIYEYKDEIVKNFSRGLQQRLSLCKLMISDPKIMILDEPFTGLDPQGIENLRENLEKLKSSERTIVLVTHEIDDSIEFCDEVVILKEGRVALKETFKGKEDVKRLYFEVVKTI